MLVEGSVQTVNNQILYRYFPHLSYLPVMGSFSPGPGTIREVTVGISVILACNPPLSVPNPLVMWALNTSAEPIHYSRRVSQDPKGNLIIASVEEQDTGLYYCIVVNEIMERRIESPRINLIIRSKSFLPVLDFV